MAIFDEVKKKLVQVHGFSNYNDVKCEKKSIVLHHTAGGSADSSVAFWKTRNDKVSTCVVIDRDGTILQCFHSDRWAFSLGINQANYIDIEKQTIAIEIASYGRCVKSRGDWYNAYAGYMAPEKVCQLEKPFRGEIAYEKYTTQQIESVRLLLLLWKERYGIDIKYHDDIFDINQRALKGQGGLYTHCCFRSDKSDIFPQPEMVEMLKSL